MAIIRVTMKDTDSLYESVREYTEEELKNLGLPLDEQEILKEARQEKYSESIGKFFEYSEYITIEFNTEANTARVITSSELYEERNK